MEGWRVALDVPSSWVKRRCYASIAYATERFLM